MGADRPLPHNKKRAQNAPIMLRLSLSAPSFVYRQDGHELSYEIGDIIAP